MNARREVDLGPPVVAWLEEQAFDVYQEVDAWRGVADLVGVRGPFLVVVELKVNLSFDLLWQSARWRSVATQVWAAVPFARSGNGRSMAEGVFAEHGVGVLEVRDEYVSTRGRPAFNRRADTDRVRKELRPEHKGFAVAGSQGGAHWTEFKDTVQRLKRYLADRPEGVPLKQVIGEVRHHYASDAGARSHLVRLIEEGVIKGVRMEAEGRSRRLFFERESERIAP